jgi:hypothetical protein
MHVVNFLILNRHREIIRISKTKEKEKRKKENRLW